MMRRRPRILVVDDDSEVARTFEVILQAEGYNVMTASSGASAQATLQRHPIDLVLLDLATSGTDPLAVVRTLCATAPGVPIIVISDQVTPAHEALAQRMGALYVLPKPPEIGELLQLCSELTVVGNDLTRPLTS
jgi:DNA-binding response OmpR family regulator